MLILLRYSKIFSCSFSLLKDSKLILKLALLEANCGQLSERWLTVRTIPHAHNAGFDLSKMCLCVIIVWPIRALVRTIYCFLDSNCKLSHFLVLSFIFLSLLFAFIDQSFWNFSIILCFIIFLRSKDTFIWALSDYLSFI